MTVTTLVQTAENKAPVSIAQKFGYTPSQIELIKRTVAKNATDDELELFFYRCKEKGLNPLLPGQIYFVKYGTNPGSVVIGIDGFRTLAQKTGKLSGIKRGVLRNGQGNCVGAWAEVYRSDWKEPAREEVALHEYDTGKAQWAKMKETMIKKVAEVAALRMAFPDEVGGMYSNDEMDQAEPRDVTEKKPSEAQIKRLFALAKSAKVSVTDIKSILLVDYGYQSTKELNLDEYNKICAELENTILQMKDEVVESGMIKAFPNTTENDSWEPPMESEGQMK
jgi:phage recombination protein Bet